MRNLVVVVAVSLLFVAGYAVSEWRDDAAEKTELDYRARRIQCQLIWRELLKNDTQENNAKATWCIVDKAITQDEVKALREEVAAQH